MGRGQKEASDTQRAKTNTLADLAGQQANQLYGIALPQFQQLLSGGGYSPEEQASITGQSMGALGSAFDAAQQRAANRVARTRNEAGFTEQEDELAREQGRQAAGVTRQNTIDFANEAQRRRELALSGLTGLYGINENQLARLLGISGQLVGPRQAEGSSGGGFGIGIGPLSFRF